MNGFYIGDIIGNSYTHENEKFNKKTKNFELFTERSKFSDDTILTFATIHWLLHTSHSPSEMLDTITRFYLSFPDREPTIYGSAFTKWAENGCKTFRESSGNGGAMRCSPIGWYAKTLEEIDYLIIEGISPTHNTDIGRLGAKIVCYVIFYLKKGFSKEELKKQLTLDFELNLNEDIDEYREKYFYTSDPIETIRPAIISFLDSKDFEDAIRNAVSFGGDTDTIATITAAISEVFYKEIDDEILDKAKSYLPPQFSNLLDLFNTYLQKN